MNMIYFDKLRELGIDLASNGGVQQKVVCPKCSQERKNKRDRCLSVNVEYGTFNCHHCGWKGKVVYAKKREYTKPLLDEYKFGEKIRVWFEKRGISPYTLQRFQISSKVKYMSQAEAERDCILFPYFRNGSLINIKYRDAEKNFMMVRNAELIFYGMDIARENSDKEVVITEGEIDAMSFYEAGIKNVISVPNGASKGSNKLEYLDNCWEYFDGLEKVLIATDNDEAGKALRDELVRRIGIDRCYVINFFDYKDANEVLQNKGKEFLKTLYDAATPCPIKGIVTLDDFEEELDHLYEHGYKIANGIGFAEFDDLIRWQDGELTVISGTPGSGKSNFLDQNLTILAARDGKKFGFFSPEYRLSYHASKIESIFIGKPFYKGDKMNREQHNLAKQFIREHFVFLKHEDLDDVTMDGLLQKAKDMILRHGINGFIIDPWNYIEDLYGDGISETQGTGEALTKLKRFKDKYGIHIWVVAHPKKMQKQASGEYEVVKPYDINGSAHFFNKADNCLSVWRGFGTGQVMVYTQKIRYNWIGKIGSAEMNYDSLTGRYKEAADASYRNPVKAYLDRLDMPNIYGLTEADERKINPDEFIEPKKVEADLPW